MNLFLDYTNRHVKDIKINISGSKSESNRLLILRQFFKNLSLDNVSDSDDTKHLEQALASKKTAINVGHAGTAMRFLTAYYALKEGQNVILSGSERMHDRPIRILVEALCSLGCEISYAQKQGYPPLQIKGKKILKNKVKIAGNVSSQYISALLLMAPSLENGLELELSGQISSRPYLEMTLSLLNTLGISTNFKANKIKVETKTSIDPIKIVIESDWSSASYFYSLIALSPVGTSLSLSSFKKSSLQGDSRLSSIYKELGVETEFTEQQIKLTKTKQSEKALKLNLENAPDLAQTIAVSCFGLALPCELTGLHTLKIKETDRLVALENELKKLGASIKVTDQSLQLDASSKLNKNIAVCTYQDHRMAMAFAPLALKVPITIEDAEVVSKSYINFWEDLEACFKD